MTRPALRYHSNVADVSDEEVDSCHTRKLRRITLRDMDPSMLVAFLVRDEEDWRSWRKAMNKPSGKPVVHVADNEPSLHGRGAERPSAVDDVESFDEDDDERDGGFEDIERS